MENRQDHQGRQGIFAEPSELLDDIARRVIGAAIEVHRHLGPGFSERVYEEALAVELGLRAIPFRRQPEFQVRYKGRVVGVGRPDFVVAGKLVVEVKAVPALAAIHKAQVISYLRYWGTSLGLLLNFKETMMRKGIQRVVWTHRPSYRQQQTTDVHETHKADDRLVIASCDPPVSLEIVEEDFDAIA